MENQINGKENAEVSHAPVINTRPVVPMNQDAPVIEKTNLDMLMGVHLQLTVELGRANLTVSEVLELQKGSVVELDRIAGEAVDIFANDSLIARGDVVVVDDKFGVRITELVPPEKRF